MQEIPSHKLASGISEQQINDIAASFQKTVVDTLVDRAVIAFEKHKPKSVVIAGGVAANQKLREELSKRIPLPMNYAPMNLCVDNAAMIASLGYFKAQAGRSIAPADLQADSSLSM